MNRLWKNAFFFPCPVNKCMVLGVIVLIPLHKTKIYIYIAAVSAHILHRQAAVLLRKIRLLEVYISSTYKWICIVYCSHRHNTARINLFEDQVFKILHMCLYIKNAAEKLNITFLYLMSMKRFFWKSAVVAQWDILYTYNSTSVKTGSPKLPITLHAKNK